MNRFCLRTMVYFLGLFSAFLLSQQQSAAQTTQPAAQATTPPPVSFAKLMVEMRKSPLLPMEIGKTSRGTLPTEAEKQELEKSVVLLREAREERAKQQIESASRKAAEALAIRSKLFVATHYLTVDTIAEEKTLRRYAASPAPELNELLEADKLMAKALQAYDMSEYSSALAPATRALAVRERILGRGYHETAECYRIIGSCQIELVMLDEAEKSLEKAVDVAEKAYGKGHPVVARMLDRQGWLHINKNDVPKALACLQTAVRNYGLTCGDTLDAAEAIDNLGTVLFMRGDTTEAISQKARALVIREKLAGPDSKEAGISYSNLAWVYGRLGIMDEVIPLRRRAYEIFTKLLGPDHPFTSTETVNLGIALQNKGMAEEAIKLYQQAVENDAKRSEPVDARVVSRTTRLGVAYFEAGRRDEADKTLKKAMAQAKEVKERGGAKAAAGELKQIAEVYEAYRMLGEAVKVLEQACAWDKESGAAAEELGIGRAVMLCNLLPQLGRAADAKAIMEKVTKEAITLFGRGERKTAGPLMSFAVACERAGDLEQAERVCEEVVRISESKFGVEHRATAVALREMGRIYTLQKKMDLAKFTFDDARKLTEAYQEYEPVEMVRLLFEIAELHSAAGDKSQAMETCRDALARIRALLQKSKTPQVKALLAKALKMVIDASTGGGTSDTESLRSELKATLKELQADKALDHENQEWLTELGG